MSKNVDHFVDIDDAELLNKLFKRATTLVGKERLEIENSKN